MTIRYQDSKLLFRALLANGIFSSLSGVALLAFDAPIATRLGIGELSLWPMGAMLLLFGLSLLRHAWRRKVSRAEAVLISVMDLGWVLGSAALLLFQAQRFSSFGFAAILVVGAIVLLFFEMQAWALWRMRTAN